MRQCSLEEKGVLLWFSCEKRREAAEDDGDVGAGDCG